MTFPNAQIVMNEQPDLNHTASLWSRIRDHLESEQRRIYEEIRNYPTPIAGCDAQFNHLLEERDSIAQELARLCDAMESGRRDGDARRRLDEFVRSSRHLDEDARRSICAPLADALREPAT